MNEQSRAPYAIGHAESAGRAHPEPPDPLRSPFELDRHRIIGCTAFRRLEHKTQVFAPEYHDHFRTRLTHTLEASHIARTLARALRVSANLAEAITLAHDLGHPPFGHAGEAALGEAMKNHGGFNHNVHSLRVVEFLEHPFPSFRGLNLTHETRAGLAAHQTRYDAPAAGHSSPSVEAQTASLADRIAYNCHDLEDAIGAGFVAWPELEALELWKRARTDAGVRFPAPNLHAVRRLVLDRLLDRLLIDAVEESRRRLATTRSLDDVVRATAPLVGLSDPADRELARLEAFLNEFVYRRAEVAAADAHGRQTVLELFAAFCRDTALLPPRFSARTTDQPAECVIRDYIAGMTDGFCRREFERVTGRTAPGPAETS